MDNQPTTAERLVSKTKDNIIKEAQRIEEGLLYSSKGHLATSNYWSNFRFWIGIPIVVLSAAASASALSEYILSAGLISILIAILSGVMTFLNPNDKASIHLSAGNNYDSLMNKVRIFWSIDCWQEESEQILTDKLKDFSEQKNQLNQSCPQIPKWAYKTAKKGIEAGEGSYLVDK